MSPRAQLVQTVLMLFSKNYQNWSVLVETIQLSKFRAFSETAVDHSPFIRSVQHSYQFHKQFFKKFS